MDEYEQERVDVTCTCDSESNKLENISNIYDNESEGKTSRTSDKQDKESMNVCNGLLNIYECVKNI